MSALIRQIVRGNVIVFTATFTDANGDETSPASAQLAVDYLDANSERAGAFVDMEQNTAGEWVAEWDSSDAKPALAYWSVNATNPSAAADGEIKITANLANVREPE